MHKKANLLILSSDTCKCSIPEHVNLNIREAAVLLCSRARSLLAKVSRLNPMDLQAGLGNINFWNTQSHCHISEDVGPIIWWASCVPFYFFKMVWLLILNSSVMELLLQSSSTGNKITPLPLVTCILELQLLLLQFCSEYRATWLLFSSIQWLALNSENQACPCTVNLPGSLWTDVWISSKHMADKNKCWSTNSCSDADSRVLKLSAL